MLFLPALRDFQGMEYSLLNQGSPRKTRTSWLLNCGVFINQTFPVSLPLLTFHLTSAYWCSLLWWIGAKASCKRRPSINQGLYNILIWRDSGKKAKSPFQFRSIPGPKDDWGYLTSLTHSPSLPAAVLRKGQAQPPQKWGAQDTGEVTEPQMRCRLLMSPLHPHHTSGGAPGSPTLQMRKLSPRERHLSRHRSDSSRSEAEFKPKPQPIPQAWLPSVTHVASRDQGETENVIQNTGRNALSKFTFLSPKHRNLKTLWVGCCIFPLQNVFSPVRVLSWSGGGVGWRARDGYAGNRETNVTQSEINLKFC